MPERSWIRQEFRRLAQNLRTLASAALDQWKNNFGVLVVEEVTTPCLRLSAARTRNLVHYEVSFLRSCRDIA